MNHAIQSGVLVIHLCLAVSLAKMVPFVIPADVNPDSQIAMKYKPLAEQDRLSADEHFNNQFGRRVRLWGVNLSFEANFPAHADAEKIARRMAAFGVNTVRCHHMDTTVWPRGIWDKDGRTLHPEALDRLDYFINQLANHGIYIDLNLHVGKKFSVDLGLPESPTDYDKMVNIFTPQLFEAQKNYARMLLAHKNPYRGDVAYAQDYAIAIAEITNENSLFMWGAENTLRTLPPFYANILKAQYNQWLKAKYGTQTALLQKWTADSSPLGESLLKNAALTQADVESRAWNLEQHAQCRASIETKDYMGRTALYINPIKADGTGWHLQFNQGQLNLQKDKTYTIEFDAAAPEARTLNFGVLQAHEPWQNLGLHQSVTLLPQWKTYRTSFTATDNDDNARLSFYFGDNGKPFCLANIKLRPGVEYALDQGESLDTAMISLYGEIESPQRNIDRMLFLAQTEKAYFDGMKTFIQKDLGCKAMVTGTIVFGPLGLYAQSDMDFIDSHAYWQHPQFPNRSWDPADWLIEQKAMSDFPEQSTLYELAAQKLSGKPFTVTEYNHPAPLDSQAECVPMIASFAAAQDWDGVWLYTYSHSNNNWNRALMNSFFDIDTNPAKWGFMPAGAYVFVNAQMQPSRTLLQGILPFTSPDQMNVEQLASLHLKVDRSMLAAVSSGLKQEASRQGGRFGSKTGIEWNNVNNSGLYVAQNDSCIVLAGRTERLSGVNEGLSVKIDHPAFAAMVIVAVDGKPIAESGKILVTACGRCENTDMKFSADRRTVSTNWGKAPVLIEPVEGSITLPGPANGRIACKALKPDGSVSHTFDCSSGTLELKAEHGTMWYLLERASDE